MVYQKIRRLVLNVQWCHGVAWVKTIVLASKDKHCKTYLKKKQEFKTHLNSTQTYIQWIWPHQCQQMTSCARTQRAVRFWEENQHNTGNRFNFPFLTELIVSVLKRSSTWRLNKILLLTISTTVSTIKNTPIYGVHTDIYVNVMCIFISLCIGLSWSFVCYFIQNNWVCL